MELLACDLRLRDPGLFPRFTLSLPIFMSSCGLGGMFTMRSMIRSVGSSRSGFFAIANRHIHIAGLEQHVEALGYLCIFFANLERRTNHLLGHLTGMKGDELGVLTNHVDFPKKLIVAKGLGFIKKPSQGWFDDLDLMLWAIENHIIPKRNRFIHDGWRVGSTGPLRRYNRTRMQQQGGTLELTTLEEVPTDAEEIWSLVEDVMAISAAVDWLSQDLKARKPVSSLPRSIRDHWSARRKPPKANKSKEPASPAQSKREK